MIFKIIVLDFKPCLNPPNYTTEETLKNTTKKSKTYESCSERNAVADQTVVCFLKFLGHYATTTSIQGLK